MKGRCHTNFGKLNTHKVETSFERSPVPCSGLSCIKKLSEIFDLTIVLMIQMRVSSPLCLKLAQSCPPKHILDECCNWCQTVDDAKECRHSCCAGTVCKGNSQKEELYHS